MERFRGSDASGIDTNGEIAEPLSSSAAHSAGKRRSSAGSSGSTQLQLKRKISTWGSFEHLSDLPGSVEPVVGGSALPPDRLRSSDDIAIPVFRDEWEHLHRKHRYNPAFMRIVSVIASVYTHTTCIMYYVRDPGHSGEWGGKDWALATILPRMLCAWTATIYMSIFFLPCLKSFYIRHYDRLCTIYCAVFYVTIAVYYVMWDFRYMNADPRSSSEYTDHRFQFANITFSQSSGDWLPGRECADSNPEEQLLLRFRGMQPPGCR